MGYRLEMRIFNRLWKMMEFGPVGMRKFPMYGKIKNVPNHQPVIWSTYFLQNIRKTSAPFSGQYGNNCWKKPSVLWIRPGVRIKFRGASEFSCGSRHKRETAGSLGNQFLQKNYGNIRHLYEIHMFGIFLGYTLPTMFWSHHFWSDSTLNPPRSYGGELLTLILVGRDPSKTAHIYQVSLLNERIDGFFRSNWLPKSTHTHIDLGKL